MSRYSSVQKYIPFEMVVDTTIAGSSGVGNFTVPLNTQAGLKYRIKIDWGDGVISAVTTNTDVTHNYSSSGTYTVKLSGRCDYLDFQSVDDADKITDIVWGNTLMGGLVNGGNYMAYFGGAGNLTGSTGTPILEHVDTLASMFFQCDLINFDTTNWDISKIVDTSSMFYANQSWNEDIGHWDVSNVESMNTMFGQSSIFNNGGSPSISGWTTSACTDMSQMFVNTSFNQPIGSWDVSNVTTMQTMLQCNYNNPIYFDQDLSNWDVSSVENASAMFTYQRNFNNGGSPGISGWTTTSITTMSQMFLGADAFNQPIGSWDTSNVTNMSSMFLTFNPASSKFNQDIGNWDVSNVTNFTQMFNAATDFNNGGSPSISGWTINTATATTVSMNSMFKDAEAFNQPIGSWDMSNVTTIREMFHSNPNFDQDIGNWDTSNVSDSFGFNRVFFNALNFNNGGSPSISGWTIGQYNNTMEGMFYDTLFNQDIGAWNVSGVTSFYSFFQLTPFNNGGSSSINNWDTGNVISMGKMFDRDSQFNQPIGNWDTSSVSTMYGMFGTGNSPDCPFNQDISNWDVSNVKDNGSTFAGFVKMFNGAGDFNNGGSPGISGWTVNNPQATLFTDMFEAAEIRLYV
jgi:surface protein